MRIRSLVPLLALALPACEVAGPDDTPLTFRKIAVGFQFTCGITLDGEAFCWGIDGMLGVGDQRSFNRPYPVATTLRFFDISSGGGLTCGLATDSTPHCWGRDWTNATASAPVQRSTLKFKSIHVGGYEQSVCGLTAAGTGYCMGHNEYGQAGVGHSTPVLAMTAVQSGAVATQLEAAYHGCLLTAAGGVQCWGYGGQGALGLADTALACDPVSSCNFPTPASVPLPGLIITQLSVGGSTTCALSNQGVARCWGDNSGVGAAPADTCIPIIPCNPRPTLVSGGLVFRSIVTRWGSTCAITLDDAGYCWGSNDEGVLGDGTETFRAAPTAIAGGLRFAQIEPGIRHSCGLTTDGKAWCWGNNISGSLGIGDWEHEIHPRPRAVKGP